MKAKAPLICTVNLNSSHQQSDVSGQTGRKENPTDACLQDVVSSSKDKGSQRTKETYAQQSHCNSPYDIGALLEGYPKIVEIPDEEYERIKKSACSGGHPDNPGELGRLGVAYNPPDDCANCDMSDRDGT